MGCTDVGNLCSSAFNGAGVCVNTTDANWDELHQNFDLSQPNVTGACLSDPDCSCCQCFKNKTWVQEMGNVTYFLIEIITLDFISKTTLKEDKLSNPKIIIFCKNKSFILY